MRPLQRIVRDVSRDHLMRLQATSLTFSTDDCVEHRFVMRDPLISSRVILCINYHIVNAIWTIAVRCPKRRRSLYGWFLEEIRRGMKRGGYKVRIASPTAENVLLQEDQKGDSQASPYKG